MHIHNIYIHRIRFETTLSYWGITIFKNKWNVLKNITIRISTVEMRIFYDLKELRKDIFPFKNKIKSNKNTLTGLLMNSEPKNVRFFSKPQHYLEMKLHCFGCAWQCPRCRPQSAPCMRQGADNLWWWPEEIIRKCCSSVIACSPLILPASTSICAAQYYLICFRPFVLIYEMSVEFSSNWRRRCFHFFIRPYVCRFISVGAMAVNVTCGHARP